MRIQLDIAGGPLDVVVTGYVREPYVELAWWTVGGRRLQVSRRGEGEPWRLTGHGGPAKAERRFDLPPANVRRAFRDFLRSCCKPGEEVDPYSTDHGRLMGLRWGWDDCAWWTWSTPNDGQGRLPKAQAVAWMRDQARAAGVRIREEGA